MTEIKQLVGKRIRQKRLELGLTQFELGRILGCTQQMIQNYETAFCEMPVQMLNDMAMLSRLPVDWFFLEEHSLLVYFTFL